MSRRFDVTEKRNSCDGQPALGGAYLCVLRDQRGPARYGYFLFRGRIGKQRIVRVGGFRSNPSLEEATNSVRRVIPDGDRYGTVIGNFWNLPTSSRRSRRSRNLTARWTSCRSRFRAMSY